VGYTEHHNQKVTFFSEFTVEKVLSSARKTPSRDEFSPFADLGRHFDLEDEDERK